jgi:hypothetical protein
VKLTTHLHSSNTPTWRGAQLKHRDDFTFTFACHKVSVSVRVSVLESCVNVNVVELNSSEFCKYVRDGSFSSWYYYFGKSLSTVSVYVKCFGYGFKVSHRRHM